MEDNYYEKETNNESYQQTIKYQHNKIQIRRNDAD